MKTTPKMQAIITLIARKFGLDLSASEAHLKLELKGYMPLVIEKVGRYKVSVTHYYKLNGDSVPDPDVVFFTNGPGGAWIPVSFQDSYSYVETAELNSAGTQIDRYYPNAQKDIAEFCEGLWANNIEAQGWLERGQRPQSDESTTDVETETE